MTIKDRIRRLRELYNIKTEMDLLIMLLSEVGHADPIAQAKKEKYNFSKMLSGERKIKHEFIIPLQKIFNVSIDYIINGTAQDSKKEYVTRGIEHAVASKSINEYIKLSRTIDKNGSIVLFNHDEYQNNVVDYIIKYNSIEGIKYFIEFQDLKYLPREGIFSIKENVEYFKTTKSLPINFAQIIIRDENYELFDKLFDKVSIIRFHDHPRSMFGKKDFLDAILKTEEVFEKNIWLKKITLYDVNRKFNKEKMLVGMFINPLVNYFYDRLCDKYNGNEEIIKKLLIFGRDSNLKIRDFIIENIKTNQKLDITPRGIIKLENSVYGCAFNPNAKNIELLSDECKALINEINEINENIIERPYCNFDGIKKFDYVIKDGILYKPSVDNPVAYQFYEFANRHNITFVPKYLGTENGMDKFTMFDDFYIAREPKGSEIVDMLRFLHAIHDLSEPELGEGKVFVHDNLSLFNVFFRNKDVIGVVNWDYCKIGDKFEDLLYLVCHWLQLEKEEDRDDFQVRKNIHTAIELFETPKERYQELATQMRNVVLRDIDRLDKTNQNYQEMLITYNRVLEFIDTYKAEIDDVELKNSKRKRIQVKRVLLDKNIIGESKA